MVVSGQRAEAPDRRGVGWEADAAGESDGVGGAWALAHPRWERANKNVAMRSVSISKLVCEKVEPELSMPNNYRSSCCYACLQLRFEHVGNDIDIRCRQRGHLTRKR